LLKIDRFTQTVPRATPKSTATQGERDTDQQTTNISQPLRDHRITHHASRSHVCVVLENQTFTPFIFFIPCTVNGFTNLASTNAQIYILYFTINLLLHVSA